MSYDFRIVEKGTTWGGGSGACSCGRAHGSAMVDLGSPTYNLDDIFRLATSGRFKQGVPVPAAEALAMWRAALADMEARPEAYKPLEPENKWGDLDGACRVARRCVNALADLETIGYLEADLWEPLASQDCDTDDEKAARPKRRVVFADLVFIA